MASAQWLDCQIYSNNPSVAPCGPPPETSFVVDISPCHFTVIVLPWKKLTKRGIRAGLTPFSINDSTPFFGHWRGEALFQSIKFAMTAFTRLGCFYVTAILSWG